MPKTATEGFIDAMEATTREIVDLAHWSMPTWDAIMRTCHFELPLTVDVDDGAGPVEWQPLAMMRDSVESRATLEVDEVRVMVPNATAAIPGVGSYPFAELAMNGAFDGGALALYQYDRRGGEVFHHSSWRIEGVPAVSRMQVSFRLQSGVALLRRTIPRTIIQEHCNNRLFDAYCGLSEAAYEVNGTATGGSQLALYAALDYPPGWFDGGKVTFTGGPNLGAIVSVQTYEPGWLTFLTPLRYPVAAGHTFKVVPGCPKTVEACRDKFANLDAYGNPKFRGYPYVPPAENLV